MQTPDCAYVDFETHAIKRRPEYPPKPVGVSIQLPGQKRSSYYAWGHPEGNNCTAAQVAPRLRDIWRGNMTNGARGVPVCFQNGKFDIDVAEKYFPANCKRPMLPWSRIHDTLFLLTLHDPYAPDMKLKPSAERILGLPPEEQDVVRDWIMGNVHGARKGDWGAYISRAPGGIVGRYADGDVLRTKGLFEFLWPSIVERGMLQAYDRERHLMPILLRNEQEGVRLNLKLLEKDYKIYITAMATADNWLRKRLRAPGMNVDSDREFADALEAQGVVTEFAYTAKGHRSVSKKNLTLDMFRDAKVQAVYGYRNILSTCTGTFMLPWLIQAQATGGRVHTSWNQVRGENKGGARTGRMSSSPNFQNVPKNWKKAVADGYVYPAFLGVPPLPNMRQYFLPDEGCFWGRRDFNQQELRLLAHFEDGELMRQYIEDPRLDIHKMLQDHLRETLNIDLPREPVKILNFADIYGRGMAAMADALKVDIQTVRQLKREKNKMLPGVRALTEQVSNTGRRGEAIRTWGGREYYTEPPKFSKKFGKTMSFEYKLLNYLIQGSGADVTKESIIRYDEHPLRQGRFMITVHDENNTNLPKGSWKQEMQVLRECMQSVETDVPMLSDGERGLDWGHLKECA